MIGHVFCPFAKRELVGQRIRYSVCRSRKSRQIIASVLEECRYLDQYPETETTLLIVPDGFNDFYRYLPLVDEANAALEEEGYEGVYQLASFHPDYCFTDADYDDAANFTNRSPYPILHILREQSLEKVLAAYPDAGKIPQRNIEHARSMGRQFWQQQLDALFK